MKCGHSLEDALFLFCSRRQVIELPPIEPLYEEYRQYSCDCPGCGHQQIADYPTDVKAPIQYGKSIEASIAYFSAYQYVPYYRLKQLFLHAFGLSISEGSIQNILQRDAGKATVIYQHIHQNLQEAPYIGSDETSAKVNGDKWWIWVWQNLLNTYIYASDNRGAMTVAGCFPQ